MFFGRRPGRFFFMGYAPGVFGMPGIHRETAMTSEFVLCKLIDIPDGKGKERSFSKEFATKLANSIQVEGMYEPIILRPSREKPGRFELIAGRHRLHATRNILKLESIEAKVYVDMDDTDAEMASIAENLWRNPLKKAQHLVAVRKWFEHYEAKYPHKVGRGNSSGKSGPKPAPEPALGGAAEGDGGERPTVGLDDPAVGTDPATAEPADVPNFAEQLSETTGESLSSAKVTALLAKTFDDDQQEIFEQMQVGRNEMHAIARIKDEAARAEIVNLIASGMDAVEAIAEVTKPADGIVTLGNSRKVQVQPKGEGEAAEAGAPKSEKSLSDQEWLETYCDRIRPLLPASSRPAFDADAILYRQLRDARQAFRSKCKKPLAALKGKPRGAFYRMVSRLAHVSHPNNWLRCGKCSGSGLVAGAKCPECWGDGFSATTEN